MTPAPAEEEPREARGAGGYALFALVLVALLARLLVAFDYERHHPQAERPVIDEAAYDRWARAIAAGDWLGEEVFFQEPLYPYGMALLYALFDGNRTAVRHAQAAVGAAGVLLVVLLGRRLFGSPAGELGGLLFALHGPALWLASLLLKETLFATVLAGLALALVSARRPAGWLVVGLLAGVGALLRGNVLVMAPFLALWPLGRALSLRERRAPALLCGAAFLAGFALVLAPVLARNRAVGGEWVLATSGAGTNLYGGNNPHNPFGRASEFPWIRGIPEHEAGDWRREAERRVGRPLSSAETSAFWRDETLRSVAQEPLLHLSILWNKLRLTLGAYEVADNHHYGWDRERVPFLALPWPGFALTGLLGIAGVLLLCLRRPLRIEGAAARAPGEAFELALLAGLYLATVVLTVTSARVRLPLVPLLAPFAGQGLVVAWKGARGAARARTLGAWALAAALAALIVLPPALPAADRAEDEDERELNLAVQLVEEGRDEEARLLLEPLRARHERSARLAVLVSVLDAREAARLDAAGAAAPDGGRRARELAARAERELRRVLGHEELGARERFRAAAALGWLLASQGREAEALEPLALARAFDAEDRELALAEARALLAAGERAIEAGDARRLLRAAREAARAPPLAAEDPRVALLGAEADLALGRALLDGGARGGEEQLARELVRAGLAALEPLDASLDPALRAAARRRAGLVQLWLGNARAAERHLRVALSLRADDRGARLGLAHALAALLDEGATQERVARRTELETLLEELRGSGAGDELEELERRLAGD